MSGTIDERFIDCKPFIQNVLHNTFATMEAIVYNSYMSEFGWVLEHGSGLYGPKKMGITIRAKNAPWLRWPDRRPHTEGWKPAEMLWAIGESGKKIRLNGSHIPKAKFWFAKATFPKGVKPKWFIRDKAMPNILADIEKSLAEYASCVLDSEKAVEEYLKNRCIKATFFLQAASGGLSNRLSGNWRYKVGYENVQP